jgi:prevent-host-death family protein
MVEIGAREANQQFSKLLARVESGEEIVITMRGKPVAKLVPATAADRAAAERERQLEELLREMREKALHGGKVVDWTRDELYERDPE